MTADFITQQIPEVAEKTDFSAAHFQTEDVGVALEQPIGNIENKVVRPADHLVRELAYQRKLDGKGKKFVQIFNSRLVMPLLMGDST